MQPYTKNELFILSYYRVIPISNDFPSLRYGSPGGIARDKHHERLMNQDDESLQEILRNLCSSCDLRRIFHPISTRTFDLNAYKPPYTFRMINDAWDDRADSVCCTSRSTRALPTKNITLAFRGDARTHVNEWSALSINEKTRRERKDEEETFK